MALSVRIATFNLENLGRRSRGGPPIEARRPTLQAQLSRLRADILCLQEVDAEAREARGPRRLAALDLVLSGTPYERYTRSSTRTASGGSPFDIHNLVVLSRFPIMTTRQIHHDLVPPPATQGIAAAAAPRTPETVRWDRPLLQVEIDLGGDRILDVMNLHLRAPLAAHIPGQKLSPTAWRTVPGWAEGFYIAAVKRIGQALEARLVVDQTLDRRRDPMIVVCGDLNAEVHETPLRLLRGDPADTGNPSLADRALVPLAETMTGAAHTVVHGGRKLRLDHILVSRALALRCREVVVDNAALLDEAEPEDLSARRPGSYHAPVVAEFELP